MDMDIRFPGGKRVDIHYGDFVIKTDQPVDGGGEGSAPTPFDLFIASIGGCSGVYLLGFMQQRNIPVRDARVLLHADYDPRTRRVKTVRIELKLPADFPPKYREAAIRAVELCSVKRHLEHPPTFQLTATIG